MKEVLRFYRNSLVRAAAIVAALSATGCAAKAPSVVEPAAEVRVVSENAIPGTVRGSWVEPMPDVVEVPGQLDPTGTYYLPKRSEVVEIRPERFREADYGERRPSSQVVEGR